MMEIIRFWISLFLILFIALIIAAVYKLFVLEFANAAAIIFCLMYFGFLLGFWSRKK